jgi:transcriptional regulator with XRE-family HTH domain
MISHYDTLTGRRLDLTRLPAKIREAVDRLLVEYEMATDWDDFSGVWQQEVARTLGGLCARARTEHVLYKIGQDMEMRLGVAQGAVAPPDYRDFIVGRIEEKYGSRYRFCQESGISEAFLSQVLSGKKNFSLEKLRQVAEILDLALVLLPLSELVEIPLTDTAALRRVSELVTRELAELGNARDYLLRLPVGEKAGALERERELFETSHDRILARLETLQEEEREEAVIRLIDEEVGRLLPIQEALRARSAAVAEPTSRYRKGGSNEARSAVSRV